MDINTYSKLAIRTANGDRPLLNAALGIGGESGEILDHLKKVSFHNKPMDTQHLIAEAGDLMWYLNLLIVTLGFTWDQVLEANIAKLEARYPDLRFDPDKANNRDTDKEAEAIAKVL